MSRHRSAPAAHPSARRRTPRAPLWRALALGAAALGGGAALVRVAATSASDLVQVVASGGGTLLAVAGLVLVAAATQRRLAARREAATPHLAPFPMALRALPGGGTRTRRRRRRPRLTLVVGTPPHGEGASSRAPAGSPPTAS